MLRNDQLDQWDRENFFHPSTHLAAVRARATCRNRIVTGGQRAATSTDRDGNRLLDAFAGLYCVNVGYGRPEIADAIADQARELAYYHSYVGHGTEASHHACQDGPWTARRTICPRCISACRAVTPMRPT